MGHVRDIEDAKFTLNDLLFWQMTAFIVKKHAQFYLFADNIKLRNITWSSAVLVLKITL